MWREVVVKDRHWSVWGGMAILHVISVMIRLDVRRRQAPDKGAVQFDYTLLPGNH